jgi:hypothetical protein
MATALSDGLQESLERLHNQQNVAKIHIQRLRYVHEASRLNILDSYMSGELSLLCDVRAFYKVDYVGRSLKISSSESGEFFADFILYLNSINIPLREYGDQQSMFVSIVEIVNGPNGVIPSLARLYVVNHEIEQTPTSGVYVSLFQHTLKFFEGFANGKFSPIIDVSGNQLLNRLQPRIVEGASEVVDSISNHEGEIIENGDIIKSMYQSLCTILRVNLNDSGISLMKRKDASFDVANVYIGPINLQA